MQARWRGQTIADSDDVHTVGGYVYFPRQAVRLDLLRPSSKTARDLECPHGVQFYDLVADGDELYDLCMGVAAGEISKAEVAVFFANHVKAS